MPSFPKYDWLAIKKAYEDGIDVETICRKYKVHKKTLQNKKAMEKWEANGTLKAELITFGNNIGRIGEMAGKDPIKQQIIEDEVQKMLKRNGLIVENLNLLKVAQSILFKNKDNFNQENIRNFTGAVKDIEAVANPQAKTNITNVNSNTAQIEIIQLPEKERD